MQGLLWIVLNAAKLLNTRTATATNANVKIIDVIDTIFSPKNYFDKLEQFKSVIVDFVELPDMDMIISHD